MTDTELIKQAMDLAGGISQKALADRLGIQPSAVSNWISAERIPDQSKKKLIDFIERLRDGSFVEPSQDFAEPVAIPPDRLRADADRCGYWAESAWCFNYLPSPGEADAETTDDHVTRTFNGLNVLHTTTFRHYFRYQPFGETGGSKECSYGFGFLRDWKPNKGDRMVVDQTLVEYLGAHVELSRGRHGNGGYFVMAPDSVLCCASGSHSYEFVGFKPECPVRTANLVLSIPKSLLGFGLPVAYVVSTDYVQYYDFGARIPRYRGDLDRLIEPWGQPLRVRRLLPEQVVGNSNSARTGADEPQWSLNWNDEDQEEVSRIVGQFAEEKRDEDREVYHVRAEYPPPLMTLLLFWPLPKRS